METSSVSLIQRLNHPLRDLVISATEGDPHALGKSEQDQSEVVDWLDKIAKGDIKSESLQHLNSHLVPRTYVVSNYLTAADVALYGALHSIVSKLSAPDYYAHRALTRYFDHIQSSSAVRRAADAHFPVVSFDLDNAPKLERNTEAPKKRAQKPTEGPGAISPAEGNEKPIPVDTKGQRTAQGNAPKKEKEKKEKKSSAAVDDSSRKAGASGKTPAPEESGEPAPSMIDLRVGRIVDVKRHPDADGLYVEQIDFAEESGPRTVVSGLVNYIPIEQMRDKIVVGVCNLKPATMRGIKSFAMVLCATSKEGKEGGIELVQPPANAKPGDRIYFEGAEFENATPLPQLNPKKKIFEAIQPGFTTMENKEAAWINPITRSVHKIRTKDGICVAPTFIGASLS